MEEMEQYRQHLDWHFRLNKREKEAAKISSFRKWYFELNVSSCWCKQRKFETVGGGGGGERLIKNMPRYILVLCSV